MTEKVWRKGHVWTQKHLDTTLRLVDVRNFAKGKKSGLEDDIHGKDWSPYSDAALTDFLTGYYAAMDDLIKHALRMRDDNVMKYRGKEKKAFEMGLNMQVLLMRAMLDDMIKEKEVVGDE